MVTLSARQAQSGGESAWVLVERLVATEGSATHPHRCALLGPHASPRDLGDVVHALCAVHGRQPGVVEEALSRAAHPDAADWMNDAAASLAVERGYLARLVAAAGPLPATPGQGRCEAALAGQRHALEMLARSDRRGCAMGAVAALMLDWCAIRPLLDVAAERFGIASAPDRLPSASTFIDVLSAVDAGTARAVAFGAQQLLAQVRGLWDLLEARAAARG